MICLKSPKSSEFAKNNYKNSGQKSLCCNNLLIELLKIGKLKNWKHLRRDSNPQHLSLRLRNTCAIGCAKETTENVFKTCTMPLTCSMSRDGEYTMSWYIHISVSRDGEYTLSWYIQLSNCDTSTLNKHGPHKYSGVFIKQNTLCKPFSQQHNVFNIIVRSYILRFISSFEFFNSISFLLQTA